METATHSTASQSAAFEALYLRLEKPLVNLVYRYVWNRDEAQDVVQEGFLRLWRKRENVRWQEATPYVYTIVLNLARTASKKRKRQSSLTGEVMIPSNTLASLTQVERERQVHRAIVGLREKHRAALLLTTFSTLSHQQIGKILGVPTGTVASRRATAIASLKKRLQKEQKYE